MEKSYITEGPIWKGLLSFFFPILVGTLFMQLYNTVDAVIVGRFVGKEALAAVGGATAVYLNLLIGFFVGLTAGAGVIVSQFIGADRQREIGRSVHTALMMALVGGIILTFCGLLFSPWVLRITKTPDEIFASSLQYLRIYFVSMIPMFIYNMGSSIMRAAGDSKSPLYILIAAVILNIFLDLLFVVAFGWKVAGVAWATVASQTVSMILILFWLEKSNTSIYFSPRELAFTPHILVQMLRLGLPAGIQSTFYSLSNLIIQSAINSFGTTTIAAWAAYGKIDAIFWTIMTALGGAVTTFAGQNYGARKYERIRLTMKETMLISIAFTIFSGILFWFTGSSIFTIFTKDSDVISEGMKMLHFLVPVWITYISIEILAGVVRGAGASFVPMIITLFGVCALRVVWLFTAVPLHKTIYMVLASYPITWVVTSVAFWIYYASGKWLKTHDSFLREIR